MNITHRLPIHYWGKKPPSLVKKYIERYSRQGDIVADLFGGSGSIAHTALTMNRRVIYVDLNVYACMVAETLLSQCDIDQLQKTIKKLTSQPEIYIRRNGIRIKVRVKDLFSVICSCGQPAEFASVSFDREYVLKRKQEVPSNLIKFFEKGPILHSQLLRMLKPASTFALTQLIQRLKAKGALLEKEKPQSVWLAQRCSCGMQRSSQVRWVINGLLEPAFWYPRMRLQYRNGIPYYQRRDVNSVDEFFLGRSLAYLAWLWHEINRLSLDYDTRNCLKVLFLNTTARASKMGRLHGGPWSLNSYWIPRRFVVRNPRLTFLRQATQFIHFSNNNTRYMKGSLNDLQEGKAKLVILYGDARKTPLLPNSVDYIITDPPHLAEAQYLELSTFFTSWLRERPNFNAELVVNPRQGKDLQRYITMLHEAIDEIQRILKGGHAFTLILPARSRNLCEDIKLKASQLNLRLDAQQTVQGYCFVTFRKQTR